ncbi:hypothetical protein MRB53_017748 [Persea americana]|uniref:Uncharacterized protein n=1 Tax=Persea americana TaxID=3435 RepID=A0ACC2M6W0_PERAE|nr:hypothetical protein MRB53_017748 [Persea americana]
MQNNRGTLVRVERLGTREKVGTVRENGKDKRIERSAGDTRARLSQGKHDMGKTSLDPNACRANPISAFLLNSRVFLLAQISFSDL